MSKMTSCLWFGEGQAREAAEFCAKTFPDSHVGAGHASPSDNPSVTAGMELTVELTLLGRSFIGLNGGPMFKPNEAISFMVGFSWQITPHIPLAATTRSRSRRQAGPRRLTAGRPRNADANGFIQISASRPPPPRNTTYTSM